MKFQFRVPLRPTYVSDKLNRTYLGAQALSSFALKSIRVIFAVHKSIDGTTNIGLGGL